VACAGGTDPASNVRATEARLNAHGYANDGLTTWWWEYDTVEAELGTAADTEVCGVGTGPKEPDNRCGPAAGGSQGNPIPLNVVVTGLTPNTTYFFRACGQDTNDPTPTCANRRSFRTTLGDSTANRLGGALQFIAASGTTNGLRVTKFTDTDGIEKYRLEDAVDFSGNHTDGSSIVPGAGCQGAGAGAYDDAVKCPAGGVSTIFVTLQDGDDEATIDDAVTVPSDIAGGTGSDFLQGSSAANDTLSTGSGGGGAQSAIGGSADVQNLSGAGGNDVFNVQNGSLDLVYCGEGNDVANVEVADSGWEGAFGHPEFVTCETLNEIP
jgi:hypothetical protein